MTKTSEVGAFDIVSRNEMQAESEVDTFTVFRYEQMARHIPLRFEHPRVLDVGCNTGRGGARMKAMLPQIDLVGLDLVQSRIDALPPVYSTGICSSATKINAASVSFDSVVAGEFLEHVPASDIDTVLCEFQRVIKLWGRLIMTTPNPESWVAIFARTRFAPKRLKDHRTIIGGAHVTQHWPRLLAQRLKMHGFRRAKLYGTGRMSLHIGPYFPLGLYGSFLITADKY